MTVASVMPLSSQRPHSWGPAHCAPHPLAFGPEVTEISHHGLSGWPVSGTPWVHSDPSLLEGGGGQAGVHTDGL